MDCNLFSRFDILGCKTFNKVRILGGAAEGVDFIWISGVDQINQGDDAFILAPFARLAPQCNHHQPAEDNGHRPAIVIQGESALREGCE